MSNLVKLSPNLDAPGRTCRAIVECPKDGRIKYDYDPKTKAFELKRLLPDGMSFPLDFGFVPGTLAADGDPLDIEILNDEPACVGAMVECRLVGLIEGEQTEDGQTYRNDRVLGVACASHLFKDVRAAGDLEESVIKNLTQFWVNYEGLRGVSFRVLAVKGPPAAVKAVKDAQRKAKG